MSNTQRINLPEGNGATQLIQLFFHLANTTNSRVAITQKDSTIILPGDSRLHVRGVVIEEVTFRKPTDLVSIEFLVDSYVVGNPDHETGVYLSPCNYRGLVRKTENVCRTDVDRYFDEF